MTLCFARGDVEIINTNHTSMNFRLSLFLCVILIIPASIQAQYTSPVKDSLYSSILDEWRYIEVTLPDSYKKDDTTRYDVWYVLDGEWDAHTFTNISSYLVAIGFMPPVIIVSVPNRYVDGYNYRDRDLTPTATDDLPNSGGANNFLAFLERELMPAIDHKFRSSGVNGLFGGSFGGMFTLYAMLERPSLFKFYTLSDPALHYDNQYVPKLAARRLGSISFNHTVLNIGGRSGLSYESMARNIVDSLLQVRKPAGLHWRSNLYDHETHGSVTFKSNYDGLKYAYLGYSSRNARFHLTGGIVLKDKPVRLFVFTDNADIHYTLDGSAPNESSTRANEFLIISDPAKLRARSFSSSGRYDHDIPVGIKTGEYLQAKKILHKKGMEELTHVPGRLKDGVLEGYVQIPKDGYYILQLTPAQGTRLTFNDTLLVQEDAASTHVRQTIILPLRKGDYSLKLEHPQSGHSSQLNFGLYQSENGQDDWWRTPLLQL